MKPDEVLPYPVYTRGCAFEIAEDQKGTIAPGMFADITVLSQDVFTVHDRLSPRP